MNLLLANLVIPAEAGTQGVRNREALGPRLRGDDVGFKHRESRGSHAAGMGKDGAAELKLMKDAGAITIAQDEASSAVHGMPGEAIRRGAASYVMSPEEIGAALPALVQR